MSTKGGYANKKKRYTSNIITLKPPIGKNSIKTHEDLLRDHSPFFKTALDQEWKHGAKREIKLPDDSAKVVTTYVDWLYKEQIYIDPVGDGQPDNVLYIRLYCFGEKIHLDEFCDATLTQMLYARTGVDPVPDAQCLDIV
ncbi:hypothetical protein DOTSEDRAFT_55104 [Dothistroma septosporum NZE10]|uniref:BTB domain-containing protein n=1 Tax=Dothistroma septosporum (strain NZE10 / CBS 128990) TaxID=675120 RepID=N1PF27_DOTSN|nr:hypothetical protein DOTSEDRAFT_55104 [Dothistroma septosporum NZE10]